MRTHSRRPIWARVPALVIPAPVLMLSHLGVSEASGRRVPGRRGPLHGAAARRGLHRRARCCRRSRERALSRAPATASTTSSRSSPATPGDVDLPLGARVRARRRSPADAKVDLFQVRTKDFDRSSPRSAASRRSRRSARPRSRRAAALHRTRPGRRTAACRSRRRRCRSWSSRDRGEPAPRPDSRRRRREPTTDDTADARAAAPPHWRLLVKHPSGSLEAAVNAVRRRNLIVSTSILGILGVSVGFLVAVDAARAGSRAPAARVRRDGLARAADAARGHPLGRRQSRRRRRQRRGADPPVRPARPARRACGSPNSSSRFSSSPASSRASGR